MHRINLNGTNDVLTGTGYVNAPGPISLDVQSDRLFMSDLWGTASKIVALNLASSALATTIVILAANTFASGIGVDTKAGKHNG
ncbi:hypothetical protein [Spirosoma pulveris]